MTRRAPAVLFYDGHCPVCRLSVRAALAIDRSRRLRSAPLDSAEADRHLGHLPDRERYGSFHLLVGDRVVSGPDAVAPLFRVLPLRPLAALIERSSALRRLVAALYHAVSRNRSRIGRVLPRIRPPSR